MVRGFLGAWRRFRHGDRGAVLLIFTIFVVPLLLVVAVATDFAQMLVVKRQLTGGVDSAALTVAALPSLSDAEAETKAEAYIRAHYPEKIGTLTGHTVKRADGVMDVTATAEVPTTFLRVAGYDKLTVTVSSQAIRQENKLEVVMVLDNSWSMNSSMHALKTAANSLVDTLMGADASSESVRIGLVPFMGAVNVGAVRGAWWLDEGHPTPLNNENVSLAEGVSLFTLFDAVEASNPGITWRGCVRARFEPHDVTDTPPDPAYVDINTLFTPFFAPDEPHGAVNDYIHGADVQKDPGKYTGGKVTGNGNKNGPNAMCPPAAIQPLTNVKATITDAIAAMEPVGQTVIPQGLVWGWRVISPGEPFTQGVPYAQTDTVKAIVIMTDGDNQVCEKQCTPRQIELNESYFSAYGYTKQDVRHLGTDSLVALNAKLQTVCENVKAVKRPDGRDAIAVYSIVFGTPSTTTQNLMRDCASDVSKYYTADTASELVAVFENIAAGLNRLRVSK